MKKVEKDLTFLCVLKYSKFYKNVANPIHFLYLCHPV